MQEAIRKPGTHVSPCWVNSVCPPHVIHFWISPALVTIKAGNELYSHRRVQDAHCVPNWPKEVGLYNVTLLWVKQKYLKGNLLKTWSKEKQQTKNKAANEAVFICIVFRSFGLSRSVSYLTQFEWNWSPQIKSVSLACSHATYSTHMELCQEGGGIK